jgi:hypothetical protein
MAGLDDALNIARMCARMIADGHVLRVTKTLSKNTIEPVPNKDGRRRGIVIVFPSPYSRLD